MPLYYDHFEVAGSSSHFNHHIPSASPSRDIDSSSESQDRGIRASGPADHRRRTAFRCLSQGTPESAA